MDYAPGTAVRDNVLLLRPLAEGAMGAVWVAEHKTLGTEVAVKFLSHRVASDNPEALARFLREARTAAQIKSPHVAQIFDQGVMDDGTPYIVMELLAGETLGTRLARETTLPLEEATLVMAQLAKALDAAHRFGIVHRDIKPDNVFLSKSGDDTTLVKVIDFGIAKASELPPVSRLTGGGMMLGTPEYMSPEQVMNSRDVDYRADLWALAVVSYEMLTGARPFTGQDIGELCCNLLRGEFRRASELVPGLPSNIDAWFERALHLEPERRFSSAHSMAVAFVEKDAVLPPTTRRRPNVRIVAAILGAALVGGALAAWRAAAENKPAAVEAAPPEEEVPRQAPVEPPPVGPRSENASEVTDSPPASSAQSRDSVRSWHDRARVEPKPSPPTEEDPGF